MAAESRGSVYTTRTSGYGIRWLEAGNRHHRSGFETKDEARGWFLENVLPRLRGLQPARPTMTLTAFVDLWLSAHAANVEASTVETLRYRIAHALEVFGDRQLEHLGHPQTSLELEAWRASLSPSLRYPATRALKQALRAAVERGLIDRDPSAFIRNPQPKAREITPVEVAELDLIRAELSAADAAIVTFAWATGCRPCEWLALERRDVDRDAGVVYVEREHVEGETKRYGKTTASRRRVPLSGRAVAALDSLPPRLDTPLLFPAVRGGHINLRNWRSRVWDPAVEAAGLAVCECGRLSGDHDPEIRLAGCEKFKRSPLSPSPYALRHGFATHALAAGIGTFELARVMGTSLEMIERTYGHRAAGADDFLRAKLDEADRVGVVVASPSEDGAGDAAKLQAARA
jgi:integrase